MKYTINKLLIHIVGSLAFLLLPLLFSSWHISSWHDLGNPFLKRDYLAYAMLLGFFYLNYYFLIPQLYLRKNYTLFFTMQFLVFFTIVLVAYAYMFLNIRIPPSANRSPINNFLFETSHLFFHFVAVSFVSLTIRINGQLMMSRKQQMDAELSYLKAQINPHFLFNTLNTIYSLSISKSDETPDSVLRLSGLMRYVLYDAHQDNVPLDKEINYLKDYIDLQKMRLGDTVLLSYSLPDAGDYFRIAPLLLIPFIENAFKFGVNPEKESKIEIFIDVKGNELIMKVNNNKVTQPLPEENRDKIGVDNTISRLAMLYPGRHSLEINESEVDYRMKLKILLT